jgi:putative ABC transport system permease protein
MIRFLIKGLIRDKHRSLVPLIVVAIGVMLTVFMHAWVTGVIRDSIEFNANFNTGHLKVVTKAYSENSGQLPVDLALSNVSELKEELRKEYPELTWVERTKFSGLIDVPDESGETSAQGPVMGIAMDLLSENTKEKDRMNLNEALVRGNFPARRGEVLMSETFSRKLGVDPGEEITLISSTMYGSMALYNFTLSGTVNFGTRMLDKGTVLVDIEDIKLALNMIDAGGEILGFFNKGYYLPSEAKAVSEDFNNKYNSQEDEFSPIMISMRKQGNLATLIDMSEMMTSAIVFIFILVLSIVLWNTGLISGLRRYGEVGVRLAIGENKGHVYKSMVNESFVIGLAGSIGGTLIGLSIAYFMQRYGLDFGDVMGDSAIMMPSVFKARITPATYFIGFVPGVVSIVLGTMLSGIGIYKRNTARLFKELE